MAAAARWRGFSRIGPTAYLSVLAALAVGMDVGGVRRRGVAAVDWLVAASWRASAAAVEAAAERLGGGEWEFEVADATARTGRRGWRSAVSIVVRRLARRGVLGVRRVPGLGAVFYVRSWDTLRAEVDRALQHLAWELRGALELGEEKAWEAARAAWEAALGSAAVDGSGLPPDAEPLKLPPERLEEPLAHGEDHD